MPKKISVDIGSVTDIKRAIQEIKAYQVWADRRTREIADRLHLIGIHEASIRFSGAQYDGANDVKLSSEEKVEDGRYIFTINADGQAVCFIEFGAGVYYNSGQYPGEKPEGVVGIGEYGKGKGNQNYWAYYGEPGSNGWVVSGKKGREVVITHGNPAAMPMYYASSEMQQQVLSIAKEVFGS